MKRLETTMQGYNVHMRAVAKVFLILIMVVDFQSTKATISINESKLLLVDSMSYGCKAFAIDQSISCTMFMIHCFALDSQVKTV